jgi:uncharacterized membrane protein
MTYGFWPVFFWVDLMHIPLLAICQAILGAINAKPGFHMDSCASLFQSIIRKKWGSD